MRVVIPSVRYGDFLAVTLPAWQALLPKADITVVTAPDDHDTARVATVSGARLVVTDAWTRPVDTMNTKAGAVHFNKALALDEAFGFVPGFGDPPGVKEYCLALDADVYPFGAWPTDCRRSDTLYGCPRYECLTPDALEAHRNGAAPLAGLHLIPPRLRGMSYARDSRVTPAAAAAKCLGYFQLFRYVPGRRFGSYRTAGKYDLDFRQQFTHKRGVVGFYVLHLGEQDRRNWQGRMVAAWGRG